MRLACMLPSWCVMVAPGRACACLCRASLHHNSSHCLLDRLPVSTAAGATSVHAAMYAAGPQGRMYTPAGPATHPPPLC